MCVFCLVIIVGGIFSNLIKIDIQCKLMKLFSLFFYTNFTFSTLDE